MAEPTKRCAVVSGSNKGIGFEICRQLAANGIVVVLTARDENRGLEAVKKLQELGLNNEFVLFHQLDVMDSASIASLAEFIKTQFGKLDILVNNAGIRGAVVDYEAMKASVAGKEGAPINRNAFMIQTYKEVEDCMETNYYGAKRMVEALIDLLQLSDSPTIVNVSSSMGKLQELRHEWAKQVLSDSESLTEAKVDEVVSVFLGDFKEGSLGSKGWPASVMLPYIVSKAAMNAYTRVLANKYPNMRINCVCPGFVKTDLNFHNGFLSAEEGAQTPVKLALMSLSEGGPSGRFFVRKEESEF